MAVVVVDEGEFWVVVFAGPLDGLVDAAGGDGAVRGVVVGRGDGAVRLVEFDDVFREVVYHVSFCGGKATLPSQAESNVNDKIKPAK